MFPREKIETYYQQADSCVLVAYGLCLAVVPEIKAKVPQAIEAFCRTNNLGGANARAREQAAGNAVVQHGRVAGQRGLDLVLRAHREGGDLFTCVRNVCLAVDFPKMTRAGALQELKAGLMMARALAVLAVQDGSHAVCVGYDTDGWYWVETRGATPGPVALKCLFDDILDPEKADPALENPVDALLMLRLRREDAAGW